MLAESEVKAPEAKAEVTATAVAILPVVKLGDQGSAVRLLQRILIANCYMTSADYTSVFNQATRLAVRAFQSDYGLTIDGVVGAQTWLQLTNHIYGPCLPY